MVMMMIVAGPERRGGNIKLRMNGEIDRRREKGLMGRGDKGRQWDEEKKRESRTVG